MKGERIFKKRKREKRLASKREKWRDDEKRVFLLLKMTFNRKM